MKITKTILATFLITFSANGMAIEDWMPPYCKKENSLKLNNVKCIAPKASLPDQEKYGGILSLTNKILANEISSNLKNMAMLDLLEKKSDLIAMFPNIDPGKNSKKYPWYKRKNYTQDGNMWSRQKTTNSGRQEWSRTHAYNGNNQKACLSNDNKILKDKAFALGETIPSKRAKYTKTNKTGSSEKTAFMAKIMLEALVAQDLIKARPALMVDLKEVEKRVATLKRTINVRPEVANSFLCSGDQAIYNKEKCDAAKSPAKVEELKVALIKKEKELSILNQKKEAIEVSILKNPYYVDATNLKDSGGNMFTNLLKVKQKINGDYKASPLVTKGVATLREAFGSQEITDLLANIKDPAEYIKIAKETPEKMGKSIIENRLLTDQKFRNTIETLLENEVVKNLDEIDESMEEVCENGENFLFRIPKMVKKAEDMYLNLASKNLKKDEPLGSYLKAHQDAHCTLIAENENSFKKWLKENAGENAALYANIAGIGSVLVASVAGPMGCPPCLVYAIGGTAALVGVGVADALETDAHADILIGLSQLGLAEHDNARELLGDARLAWGLVVVDGLTAPFGLSMGVKGAQVVRAGKRLKEAKQSLKGTDLASHDEFFAALAKGLPDEEYAQVIAALKELNPAAQKILNEQLLKQLAGVPKSKRIAVIRKTLTAFQVDFPGYKQLNSLILQSLETNPAKLAKIKIKYTDYLKSTGVKAGSSEEATELRILGIIERKGCAGSCPDDTVMSVQDTVTEVKRVKKENGCG